MIPGVRRESSEPILYRRIPGGVLVGPEQAPGSPFHSGGMLCGESHRERVITPGEETRYLASAPSLLSEIATVLVDTGLRPEECYRLLWDSINWVNSRNGTLLVTHGKTKAARRGLPMTPRVRHVLETRWDTCGRPLEGYVWPAPTLSGH
jgi:hypothetical protein